jgi:hypothetical protein
LSNVLTHTVSLTAPQDLVITKIGPDIQLDWTAQAGVTSYKVYGSDDPYGVSWILLGSPTTNEFLIPGVVDPYKFYKVTAAIE